MNKLKIVLITIQLLYGNSLKNYIVNNIKVKLLIYCIFKIINKPSRSSLL